MDNHECETKNRIKQHIIQQFPPKELGYIVLDENSNDLITEHLAWYLLNVGVSFYDIVTSCDDVSGDDDANKSRLFAHVEWQADRIYVYSHHSDSKCRKKEFYANFYWLTQQLPCGKGEARRNRQRIERWDALVAKASGSFYRPELAIHEVRNRLRENCGALASCVEMLAFHAAAENGDIGLVESLLRIDASLTDDKDYHENNALHFAALAGQVEVMKLLVDRNLLHSKGFNDRTPLILAARNGEVRAVQYALEKGANLYAKSGDADRNFLAIHVAAKYGHFEVVELLLSKDEALKDATDSDGYSAIHYASAAGHLEVVKFLVELKGVDVNKTGYLDRTPLFVAAMTGSHEVVGYLLSKGVIVKTDPHQPAPIHAASIFGHLKVIELLLQPSAALNTNENEGRFLADATELAFHYGHFPLWVALKTKHGDDVKQPDVHNILCPHLYRRAHNASASAVGMLAFNEAARNNDFASMELLISFSDSLLPGEIDYVKALRIAAEKGHLGVVKSLVEDQGMNADERRGDEGSRTPLIAAASRGHVEVVEYLMTKGADIRARSWNYQLERCERTAVHIAADRGYAKVIEALVSRDDQIIYARDGADDVALRYAARSGAINVLELLIGKYGQHADTPGCADTTALMYAAGAGQRQTVEYLLRKGANLFARTNDCYHEGGGGFTAVHFACRSSNIDIVELLLNREPRLIELKTDDGRSLLHWAARCNLLPFVRYLLEKHSMDVDARGYNGRTPLMEAASAGADQVVDYLLDNGADITARSCDDYAQMTALCFCFQDRDHLSTSDLLLSRGATLPIELYNYLILLSPTTTAANEENQQQQPNNDDHDFPDIERLPGAGSHFTSNDS